VELLARYRGLDFRANARRYVEAAGTVRVRIQSAQRFPAYALSVELLRVTIPPERAVGAIAHSMKAPSALDQGVSSVTDVSRHLMRGD